MKNLFFDESGFTGNNLLDKDQEFFCYLGLETNPLLEEQFIQIKKKYSYNLDEVKGSSICNSTKGKNAISELWDICTDKAKYVVHNKKFALSAKIFEYVYEPVFSSMSTILYGCGFHKFIANLFYSLFEKGNTDALTIFSSFQQFVRDKEKKDFLSLIGSSSQEKSPFLDFYNFCQKYQTEIASDVDFTNGENSWLLDLTFTSLYNLLGEFEGNSIEPLNVTCDKSKPLIASTPLLDAMIGCTEQNYIEVNGNKARLTFNLNDKIKFSDSKKTISLQISDWLVSSINYSFAHSEEDFSKQILSRTKNCFIEKNSVLPEDSFYDYNDSISAFYFLIMHELSKNESKEFIMNKVFHFSQKLGMNQLFLNF